MTGVQRFSCIDCHRMHWRTEAEALKGVAPRPYAAGRVPRSLSSKVAPTATTLVERGLDTLSDDSDPQARGGQARRRLVDDGAAEDDHPAVPDPDRWLE